jgi:Methyltransferase domain
MSKYFQVLFGFNLAALLRGLRFGPRNFFRASRAAYLTIRPFERLEIKKISEELAAIPEVPLEKVLGDKKPEVKLHVMKYEDGILPSSQAMALLAIAVAAAPKVVLEIGTFMGHTTKQLAANLPDAIIHSVDLPLDYNQENDNVTQIMKDDFHLIARRKVGREYRGTPYEARIRQHFVDTAIWDFSEAAGATLFFIDGSHTYDYCKNDSNRCYELCHGKGIFLWHDCEDAHPGVVKALLEWRTLGRNVIRIEGTPIAYWKSAD